MGWPGRCGDDGQARLHRKGRRCGGGEFLFGVRRGNDGSRICPGGARPLLAKLVVRDAGRTWRFFVYLPKIFMYYYREGRR
jgi:hypothetical protein